MSWATRKNWWMFAALAAIVLCSVRAHAQSEVFYQDLPEIYINEIFLDSPGSPDNDEYFEVRVRQPFQNTIDWDNLYFVQLENERTMSNSPGIVDFSVQLNNANTLSFDDGWSYHWWAPTNHGYSNDTPDDTYSDFMENSGGTFLLVDTGGVGAPSTGDNWDPNDNGRFDGIDFNDDWVIWDAVGFFSESGDLADGGRLYSEVNFSPGDPSNVDIPQGGSIINTDRLALDGAGGAGYGEIANGFDEIEYVGRMGDSLSQTDPIAWVAANLTDNANSGYTTGDDNYGVSGDHTNMEDPEVVWGEFDTAPFGYGHDITTNLGARNVAGPYTPEPTSCVLLSIGTLALSLVRRRNT